jgi:hypothetical protein
MERRDLFRIIAATAATAGSGIAQHAGHSPGVSGTASAAPRFFSADEYRLLDALCGIILPADEEGGGAVEAGVARYIDTVVNYSDAGAKQAWRAGLAAVDRLAVNSFGKQFLELSQADREHAAGKLAENETAPKNDLDRFFVRLKAITIDAFFQSEAGMQYVGYKGNAGALTFPGCTHDHHAGEDKV